MRFFKKRLFSDILPAKDDILDQEKIKEAKDPLILEYSFLRSFPKGGNFKKEEKNFFKKKFPEKGSFTLRKRSSLKKEFFKILILFLFVLFFSFSFFLLFDEQIKRASYSRFFERNNFDSENFFLCLDEAKRNLNRFDIFSAKVNFDRAFLVWQRAFSKKGLGDNFLASIVLKKELSPLEDINQMMEKADEFFSLLTEIENKDLFFSLLRKDNYQRKFSHDLEQGEEVLTDLSLFLEKFNRHLKNLDFSLLPSVWQKKFAGFQKNYLFWQSFLESKKDALKKIEEILAKDSQKNYLFLIQNEDAIRATGGKIEYFLFVSLEDLSLKKISSGKVSNFSLSEKIVPPHPFWVSKEVWQLEDMNYFFDFPSSAEKIISYFEKLENKKIDGLFALNKRTFLEILEIVGSLNSRFGQIEKDNFFEKAEECFSQKGDFFEEVLPLLFEKIALLGKEEKREVKEKLSFLLFNKDIQAYFRNKQLESWLKNNHLSGEILKNKENQDYLAVVSTNVEEKVKDSLIDQEIEVVSTIKEDGSIIDRLEIERSLFSGKEGQGENRVYLRIYLPLGAKLLSFKGGEKRIVKPLADFSLSDFLIDQDLNEIEKNLFKEETQKIEIFQEKGKTVFATWLYAKKNHPARLVLEYQLPFKLKLSQTNEISFLYQKQSSSDSSFLWQVNLPEGYSFANKRDHFEVYLAEPKASKEFSFSFFKKKEKEGFFPEKTEEEMIVSSLLPSWGRGVVINLTKMRVNLYKNKKKVKVLFLVSRGERGRWFQTPLGYFEVISKKKIVHSSKVDVYMPWGVQFYEDFFIHGIPYYSNYQKVSSHFSGGCLRLKDAQAKELYDFVRIGVPIIIYEDKNLVSLGENFVLPVNVGNFWIKKDFNSPLNIRGYYGPTDVWDTMDKYYQHTGVDFACSEKVPVVSIGDGKIVKIQELGDDHGMGRTIIIEHQSKKRKIYSLYAHLGSVREDLEVGDLVKKGEIIGLMGSSGFGCQNYWRVGKDGCYSTNPLDIHLHFEIKERPVLENPRGGRACLNKFNKKVYCYGYTPKDPKKYGYFDPLEILKE